MSDEVKSSRIFIKEFPLSRNKEKALKFEVKFYSGHKGDETPRSVIMGQREFKIDEVIERKRVRDLKSGKSYEVFKCKMEGEMVEIERHESGQWGISFLGKP